MLNRVIEADDKVVLPQSKLLELLMAFRQTEPLPQFNTLLKSINWQVAKAPYFIKAIELAIWFNLSQQAVKLANLGLQRFPHNPDLRYWAWALAPPKVVGASPVNEKTGRARKASRQASARWFRTNAKSYRGQWVAVQDGKLLAAATTRKAAVKQLKGLSNIYDPIVTRVL